MENRIGYLVLSVFRGRSHSSDGLSSIPYSQQPHRSSCLCPGMDTLAYHVDYWIAGQMLYSSGVQRCKLDTWIMAGIASVLGQHNHEVRLGSQRHAKMHKGEWTLDTVLSWAPKWAP